MQNKNIIRIAFITGLILLIPLLAMQFTAEVNWTLFDFIFAGILLFGTGLIYEFITRKENNASYHTAVKVALVASFLLIWINAAVGLIGNENNPANLMYFAVLAIGFIGSILTRFKSKGMTYVLFAMAIAQTLVPIIALIFWNSDFAPQVIRVFILNTFFAMLFVLSGLLFKHANASMLNKIK